MILSNLVRQSTSLKVFNYSSQINRHLHFINALQKQAEEAQSSGLPSFTSVPCKSYHSEIFDQLFFKISKIVFDELSKENKQNPHVGSVLKTYPDYHLNQERFPLSLESSYSPMSQREVIDQLDHILEECLLSPSKASRQTSTINPVALIGDILGTVLSSPPLTYLFAPVATLMELEVFKSLGKLIGYREKCVDGLFLPGTGLANLCTINLAIHNKFPEARKLGLPDGTNPCALVSKRSFKNFRNAWIQRGLDSDSCIPIDDYSFTGTMNILELEKATVQVKQKGFLPLLVVGSLGTQNKQQLVDSLRGIHELCLEHDMWFYVDGSEGGPLVFSRGIKDEDMLDEIEQSDSITLGMDSLLGIPKPCVALLTKHKGLTARAWSIESSVITRPSKLYDVSINRGNNTPLGGRRADVFKLWLMWKYYGTNGMGRIVEINLSRNTANPVKPETTESLFVKCLESISEKALYFEDSKEGPINFHSPDMLQEKFDFELKEEPLKENNERDLQQIVADIIHYSNKIPHPNYIFQLTCGGLDPYGIVGDVLSSFTLSVNSSYSDDMDFLMEREIVKASRDIVGYPELDNHHNNELLGGGLICAGATVAIMESLKQALVSNEQLLGVQKRKSFKIFLTKNSHACFQKAGLLLGFGMDNFVFVDTNEEEKMSPDSLRREIMETIRMNQIPLFVGATAGTTVQGVFDPILEISQICREFGVWMHVDGSFGGSAIFSSYYKEKYMKGLSFTDSFNFNPHKWLGLPTECTVLLFRNKLSTECNQSKQFLKEGTRNIAMKFWMTWKSKGLIGLQDHIEYSYYLKDSLMTEMQRIKRRDKFRLWKTDFETPHVLFHYVPKSLRHLNNLESEEMQMKLGMVAERLHDNFIWKGNIKLGLFKDGSSSDLLRIVCLSSGIKLDNLMFVLDEIDRMGEDIVL